MESGISKKIEVGFYIIFNYYEAFFSKKSFYFLNKMNIITELSNKLQYFSFNEKNNVLKNINLKIELELKSTQEKKELILRKLIVIRHKITKLYMTQKEFRDEYFKCREAFTVEMINKMDVLKKQMNEINITLLNLQNRAKKLIFLRQKFNSEYLDENNKDKMILFTQYFLNFCNSVSHLKNNTI